MIVSCLYSLELHYCCLVHTSVSVLRGQCLSRLYICFSVKTKWPSSLRWIWNNFLSKKINNKLDYNRYIIGGTGIKTDQWNKIQSQDKLSGVFCCYCVCLSVCLEMLRSYSWLFMSGSVLTMFGEPYRMLRLKPKQQHQSKCPSHCTITPIH